MKKLVIAMTAMFVGSQCLMAMDMEMPKIDQKKITKKVEMGKQVAEKAAAAVEKTGAVMEEKGQVVEEKGAELENSVRLAMFNAFDANREFTARDIEHAISEIVPLSKTKAEHIDGLRAWAETRAKKANGTTTASMRTGSSTVPKKKGKIIVS